MTITIPIPGAVPLPSPVPVRANNYSPLHAIGTAITACAATDTKARAVQPGMMPELLTGKIRLI